MTKEEKAALDAMLRWHKFIGSIGNISTDAPYQSKQVRDLFAACDALVKARRADRTDHSTKEKP